MNSNSFNAYRIHNDENGYRAGIESITHTQLSAGDTLIAVHYSSVNFKDALAGTGQGKILRQFPLNGGIDCSGIVLETSSPHLGIGDKVLVTGSGLSENSDGGFSPFVRVMHQHVIALPNTFSLRDAMILGTAGFTAGLALYRMLENNQTPSLGPIAITGATGGVGMLATRIFSRAGFDVHAISGKPEHSDYLRELGASEVLSRTDILSNKPMDTARFGGALDNVGGSTLASLLAQTAPYGNVASCGLVDSHTLDSTVMPFIIRGVSLLGIASAGTARNIRENVWLLLAKYLDRTSLQQIAVREISLSELDGVFAKMLAGQSFGRTVVKISANAC